MPTALQPQPAKQKFLTHKNPADVTAMAWAILARAAAIMDETRSALTALHQAEALYATTSDSTTTTAYVFTRGQLHFYRSHALTTVGETRAAWSAQSAAAWISRRYESSNR